MTDLAAVFSSSLPAGRSVGPAAAERIAALWRTARAAWPALPDDPDGFARHLAAIVGAMTDVAIDTALAAMHAADLYLALHCASGDPRAIELLLDGPFRVARATLIKLHCSGPVLEDLEQQVRSVLLATAPGARPKLADYAGRGELASWIASITARTARRRLHAERRRPDAPGDDVLIDVALPGDDPELAFFKTSYREAFAAAVRDALGALSPRERVLLRQHHLDRLTLDELAALHGVHRATVARWLSTARAAVVERTHQLLVERLAIAEDEIESIVRLVHSQAHISFDRLLAGQT